LSGGLLPLDKAGDGQMAAVAIVVGRGPLLHHWVKLELGMVVIVSKTGVEKNE